MTEYWRNDKTEQFVTFLLDGQMYGISVLKVQGVEKQLPLTPVPRAPLYSLGVANLRGSVIPIVDLRKKLELENLTDSADSRQRGGRILVLATQEGASGILVDRIRGIEGMPENQVDVNHKGLLDPKYVHGTVQVDEGLITLLNIERIMSNA